MIVVTGAEGFIGSCLVACLNQQNFNDLILVDDFDANPQRKKNMLGKVFKAKVERKVFFEWMDQHAHEVQFVFHIGARTDTTEKDEAIFKELNIDFSKRLFKACTTEGIPIVYASSAATYGNGENGYTDDEVKLSALEPLNPYGRSKNEFDKWVLDQPVKPYFWVSLKFFNVFGPNENHKQRMASVVYHAYHQIKETGKVKLFKSHRDDYKDGEQKRDFIYVKDLCDVCMFFLFHRKNSGIYNLGSGHARTWNAVAESIFKALQLPTRIEYIPIPEDIRETYQYFTEANMQKLIRIGYSKPFLTVEDAVTDYVQNYLEEGKYI
ncbi:MAG: ADP-glyceromanno-heptose 6-epimerase [Bacteroidia bacterium]|nr:ADP-glyceromanno-heptose 6-epimerase [Bacteroidia bacterium]